MIQRKFHSFHQLLEQGRKNFLTPEENITGLEEHTRPSVELLRLNDYMYTIYSTNVNDKVLTVEGVIPLNIFLKIESKLKEQGYWYVAINPLNEKVYGMNLIPSDEFDPKMAEYTIVDRTTIEGKKRYRDVWEVICIDKEADEVWLMNEHIDIHFLPPYNGERENGHLVSSETLSYTDESLYKGKNPLIDLLVEDRIVGRISLYRKLYQFLHEANQTY